MNSLGGVCRPVPKTLQHQLVCDTKTTLLLFIVEFEGPGCFVVGCSVLEMWNVKMSAFFCGNKVFFKASLPTTQSCIAHQREICIILTDQRLILHQIVKCGHTFILSLAVAQFLSMSNPIWFAQ